MAGQSHFPDTIFALSTGGLPSGVAVIRISGQHVAPALESLVGGVPAPRQAVLRHIFDAPGAPIDRGLVLFFQGPASFTGEDCAELHLHGGRSVVAATLAALAALPGLRAAEAGEFTRRAFINGKIDLTGAEALADLIAAETETQRRMALSNAEGGQAQLYSNWRQRLLHARAMIEAELDFADEGDVPGSVSGTVWADMAALAKEISNHIDGYRAAEIVRDGFRVVLVGAPNAGKSSLLNALARRDVAIVTDVPGTTRDLVEVALDLNGMKVLVTDTAGIRQTRDVVERIGVDRALEAAARADLVVQLTDPAGEVAQGPRDWDAPTIRVWTKADKGGAPEHEGQVISALTGIGMAELIAEIATRARDAAAPAGGTVPSRLRQVELLRACRSHIEATLRDCNGLELRAEELRLAGDSVGRITGAIDVEDLLGVIFSEFCIGK